MTTWSPSKRCAFTVQEREGTHSANKSSVQLAKFITVPRNIVHCDNKSYMKFTFLTSDNDLEDSAGDFIPGLKTHLWNCRVQCTQEVLTEMLRTLFVCLIICFG